MFYYKSKSSHDNIYCANRGPLGQESRCPVLRWGASGEMAINDTDAELG